MKISKLILAVLVCITGTVLQAQIKERPRPPEWKNLVPGGRFMDLFLPMQGKISDGKAWGVKGVRQRYTDNGIEHPQWSYWGGKIIHGEDGKYHLYVCGWPENSPGGHSYWPKSIVFNAVSDTPYGPFTVRDTIGKGHNPEIFRLSDGRYVIYVINGYYIAGNCNGPWTYNHFEFNKRDRKIIEGLTNLTFAQREDGSYIMICRGGGVWFSQTGLSPWNQVTDRRIYPDVEGNFEDPVIWRDNVQYNLIVNDWLGRIAFYERSKDGVKWIVEPGEAYMPGIAVHPDGTKEDWFKYERIKIFQDEYGRAIQANFAVIDTLKALDRPDDNHSSKNIAIPLTRGLLLTILEKKPGTSLIRVRIAAEADFDPHSGIDINSLQFGDPGEVNYGRGAKVVDSAKEGKDLIVTFDGSRVSFAADEFAAKMTGRTSDGKLLFGYARLPWIDFNEPILSPLRPVVKTEGRICSIETVIQNFGQVRSGKVPVKVVFLQDGKEILSSAGSIKPLDPFEKITVRMKSKSILNAGSSYDVMVYIDKTLSFTVKSVIEN